MTFAAHGFGHAERGQRIDEAGSALGRRRSGRQQEAVGRFQRAVLRVHRAAEDGDDLAHQVLRIGAGLDDGTRTFIAGGQRLADAHRHGAAKAFRDRGRDLHVGAGAGEFRGAHIGGAKQKANVRGIDRRGLDANHDLVAAGIGNGYARQTEFEFALVGRERAKL